GVDTVRTARHDGDLTASQAIGKIAGDVLAVLGSRARTDDADRPHAQRGQVSGAAHPQGQRGYGLARLLVLGPPLLVLPRARRARSLQGGEREVWPVRRLRDNQPDAASVGR